ncbi:MAG: 4-hydroxy-tetrahydrodipicolinate synthase [Spirochaetaceae bacterium]|nr:MAG: 4-hydroxy-tetrahydrodipicolinate synthase [Spirochaetaceae bacterium]
MFKGAYTALITPFEADESIDEGAMRALVDMQIEKGIAGLVPVGTTGESPTVTHDENIRVVEIVVKQAAGRVPVIAGTGSNSTREAVDMTRRARDIGADATLQVAPYYNKPNQEGFYQHFSRVADEGGLPVVVYNIPGRTGKNIENETMLRLAKHPQIVAVKEASGSIAQVMDLISQKPADFAVLSGDDNLALPIMLLGGSGVISVASNLIPDRMSTLAALANSGDHEAALRLHYELLPFFRAVFMDTNPIPIKYAMHLAGYAQDVYRLPMCPLAPELKRRLESILNDCGLL